jgi:hypothetical protein
MHYCDINFKTKKALKDRVAARQAYVAAEKAAQITISVPAMIYVAPVTVYNPEAGLGQDAPTPENGKVAVGGPHYPAPHVWYATVTLQNGEVVAVK